MDGSPPLLDKVEANGRIRLVASGTWTGAYGDELENLIASTSKTLSGVKSCALDVSAVSALDTIGAWLLERSVRENARKGVLMGLEGLPPGYQELMAQIGRTNQSAPLPAARSNPAVSALAHAQREILAHPATMHPYYWAAFELLGGTP